MRFIRKGGRIIPIRDGNESAPRKTGIKAPSSRERKANVVAKVGHATFGAAVPTWGLGLGFQAQGMANKAKKGAAALAKGGKIMRRTGLVGMVGGLTATAVAGQIRTNEVAKRHGLDMKKPMDRKSKEYQGTLKDVRAYGRGDLAAVASGYAGAAIGYGKAMQNPKRAAAGIRKAADNIRNAGQKVRSAFTRYPRGAAKDVTPKRKQITGK